MKQSEIIETATKDLHEKLVDARKAFTDLQMAHTISPLENPIQLRSHRRAIARIETELTKREVQ